MRKTLGITPSSLARCISQQVEIPLTQDRRSIPGNECLYYMADKRTYGFLGVEWSRLAAKSILIQSVSSTIPVYVMHTTRDIDRAKWKFG